MIHHVQQRSKSSVVVKASFAPGEQTAQRSSAIALIGRSVHLEVINPDFGRRVHVPTRFSENRRHMADGTLRFVFEQNLTSARGRPIKTPFWRLRSRNGQLIKMQ